MPARRKYPGPPLLSEDPADWFMYSDILQDIGAGRTLWGAARLTAESLRAEPRLYLLQFRRENYPVYWQVPYGIRHNLSTIGVDTWYGWFRPEWIPHLLAESRYGSDWYGTLARVACEDMKDVLIYVCRPEKARTAFFRTHAMRKRPRDFGSGSGYIIRF